MKLIVGLGNPGLQYSATRHNAGFLALDLIVLRHGRAASRKQKYGGELVEVNIGSQRALLLWPTQFMNRSGESVGGVANFYKINTKTDMLVLVDDYALPLGQIRIRADGGAGGHNGLTDIERALGNSAYPRLRIGIDPPPPTYNDPADWVLGRFTSEQLDSMGTVCKTVADAVDVFVTQGLTPAMNRFNGKGNAPKKPANPPPAASNHPGQPNPASGNLGQPNSSGPAPLPSVPPPAPN